MDEVTVFLARYLVYLAGLLWLIFFLRLNQEWRLRIFLAAVVGAPLGFLFIWGLGELWFNERPFVVAGTEPLFSHAPDNGFPSNHATVFGFAVVLIAFSSRRGSLLLLLLGLMVAWARVTSDVHHWADIFVGFIAGGAAAGAGLLLAPRFQQWYQRVTSR